MFQNPRIVVGIFEKVFWKNLVNGGVGIQARAEAEIFAGLRFVQSEKLTKFGYGRLS